MSDDIDRPFRELADEYFPGSRHRRRAPKEVVPEPDVEPWDTNPKVLKVKGEDVEFFTISHLANALHRTVPTMRKWMREGVIPEARYRTPDHPNKRGTRLWRREEVETMMRIANEEGWLTSHRHKSVDSSRLTERITESLYELRHS